MRIEAHAFATLLALLLASGAARADECQRACQYMRTISEKEVAGMTNLSPAERAQRNAKYAAGEPARMAKCTQGCRDGRIDTKCVFAAKVTLEYIKCLKPRVGGPDPNSNIPPAQQAELMDKVRDSQSFHGRALPAAQQGKYLAAIAKVEAGHRVGLVGAVLEEAGAPMYGTDLVEAFRALAQFGGQRMGFAAIARPLSVPLAAMGCARQVAEVAQNAPDGQAAALLSICPPAGQPRYFTVAQAGHAPLDRLLLAMVLEHRARQSGFAADPLHKKCVSVLLSP